jgi:phosphatidate cytidylyltransferase
MQLTSLTVDQMNIINFCMSAASLVGAVIQLAMLSGPETEDLYREYLGKLACCHFSLVSSCFAVHLALWYPSSFSTTSSLVLCRILQLFLVGQSSFWFKTVQEYGLGWVLFPAFLVIVNDTMAYVFGVLMGKHKLIPKLSPKKTVEGFVGAGLSTVAIASPLVKRCIGNDIPNLRRHAVILAAYASLVSPFGGFLASAVKRAHGAKDFGALIPGHGGVVDRFDCQVVTAPFVYLYLKNCYNVES